MSPTESAISLLHLSAVVSVLTVAYVGIDRTNGGVDPFDDGLAAVRENAKELVLQLGLGGAGASVLKSEKWGKVRTLYPACVICFVAAEKVKLGWLHRVGVTLYRQKHVPLLGYFRLHWNMHIVGVMAAVATALFLSVSYALIWRQTWVENDLFLRTSYTFLALSTVWVLLTGVLSTRLKQKVLLETCDRLNKTVLHRLENIKSKAKAVLSEFDPL